MPFALDFGLFPAEPSPTRAAPVAATSSTITRLPSRSRQPAPGPSSRPFRPESPYSPVITLDDYEPESDSDSESPRSHRPEPLEVVETQVTADKGKGREGDPDPSPSVATGQVVTPSTPAPSSALAVHLPPSTQAPQPPPFAHPPPSAPTLPPPLSPPRRHFASNHRTSRHSRNRPSHQRVPSDIADPPHSYRNPRRHILTEIRYLVNQALAAVPRAIEAW